MSKLPLVRIVILLFAGLFGAYIGDLVGYSTIYYIYPQLRIGDVSDIYYISSIDHVIGFVIFAMLVYSPGLAITWGIRRPSFLCGLTAPLLIFTYYLLVFFIVRFNLFDASLTGFGGYIVNTISAAFICTILFVLLGRRKG